MKTFKLRGGKISRGLDVRDIDIFMTTLDFEKSFRVNFEEWQERLPDNLQARISILIRELAQFCGYSESQMKYLVKQEYYPFELVKEPKLSGKMRNVPKSTMKLTPQEAREVEAHLYNLGATLGCPLSLPQAKG